MSARYFEPPAPPAPADALLLDAELVELETLVPLPDEAVAPPAPLPLLALDDEAELAPPLPEVVLPEVAAVVLLDVP